MSEQKGSFFRRVLESGFGRTVSGLVEEVKNDSRMAAGDMRSFTSGIRSDISGVCGKFGRKASREDCKAPASEDGSGGVGELAEELGEGASALRDNANAHGEDIRRAAGIPAGQAEQEVTPEEVTESLGELADELGEGASALRDNANAHGEDIRRAAGIPADRKEGA